MFVIEGQDVIRTMEKNVLLYLFYIR